MRFVLSFIKVLKMSRLFHQDQDQDQDFFFKTKTKTKTKTIFHVLEAPRDQDQGLETTSLLWSEPFKTGYGLETLHYYLMTILYRTFSFFTSCWWIKITAQVLRLILLPVTHKITNHLPICSFFHILDMLNTVYAFRQLSIINDRLFACMKIKQVSTVKRL